MQKGEGFYKTDAEWCGHCGDEVPLSGKFEVQTCSGRVDDEPDCEGECVDFEGECNHIKLCGARLLPCSSCKQDGADSVDCNACSLGG